ncbi:helix-turn-helix domain-containing protein [Dermacoccus nishinomiyaensis]
MDIASRLRAARIEAGLTQTALAQGICALSYVSHLEAGRREPSDLVLRKFEERLGLAAGSLQARSDLPHPSGARAATLIAQAFEHQANAAYASALECAHRAREAARAAGEAGAEWLALKCEFDAATGLGSDERALELGDELVSLAESSGDPSLAIRAELSASGAHYLFGQLATAQDHASRARDLSGRLAPGDPLRTKALCAALNADPSNERVAANLKEELKLASDPHIRGAAAWVLGNRAFREGKIQEGLELHEQALVELSPAADYRNWTRFLRATITERALAGTSVGVDDLLPRAHHAIDLLGNADEAALLAGAEARLLMLDEHHCEAVAVLEPHLDKTLPQLTRAELLLVHARALSASGEAARATRSALEAAKLFTAHRRVDEANEAWALAELGD